MSQETDSLTDKIGDLSLALSLLLTACQGAALEQRTLELDDCDKLLLDCGATLLEDMLQVLSFLAGCDGGAPEAEELVTFNLVVQVVIKNLGKRGYPRAASGIEGYVRSVADTMVSISRLGAGWVDMESIESAQQFFVELGNSLPGEVVTEKARVIVQIPDELISGLRRAAQEHGVTVSKLVAKAIAESIGNKYCTKSVRLPR